MLSEIYRFNAYAVAFTGGVNVAAGDTNFDGLDDIVTGPGRGGGPQVRIFDAVDHARIANFYAYDQKFSGGVSVATGDLDGDGDSELITGSGPGGGPQVRVFDELGTRLASFFAYDSKFTGGVFVGSFQHPPAETELLVNPGDRGFLRVIDYWDRVVEYFGRRDPEGLPEALELIRVQNASGTSELFLDERSRPVEIISADGVTRIEWLSDTQIRTSVASLVDLSLVSGTFDLEAPIPDVGRFDGSYTGTWGGRSLAFRVDNGQIITSQPGRGLGSLDAEGRGEFDATIFSQIGTFSQVAFAGTWGLDASGMPSASGVFTRDAATSGTWSATLRPRLCNQKRSRPAGQNSRAMGRAPIADAAAVSNQPRITARVTQLKRRSPVPRWTLSE